MNQPKLWSSCWRQYAVTTAQASTLLLVSMCRDTAQALMLFLMSTCLFSLQNISGFRYLNDLVELKHKGILVLFCYVFTILPHILFGFRFQTRKTAAPTVWHSSRIEIRIKSWNFETIQSSNMRIRCKTTSSQTWRNSTRCSATVPHGVNPGFTAYSIIHLIQYVLCVCVWRWVGDHFISIYFARNDETISTATPLAHLPTPHPS